MESNPSELSSPSPPSQEGYKPRKNVRTREKDEFTSPKHAERVAKRRCKARFSLPSREGTGLIAFECAELNHVLHDASDVVSHRESGRVRLRNGRVYEYDIYWSEPSTAEVWREEK